MNAAKASLLNAIILVAMGLWGYVETKSGTSFIPVGFGLALLLLNTGVKKENKILAHIAVLLTLVVAIALLKPLNSAITDGRQMAILRVGVMEFSSLVAMVFFVKSFIDARKAKAE